jgi:hypothetical protein
MKTNKIFKSVPFLLVAIFMTSISASAETKAVISAVVDGKATNTINTILNNEVVLDVNTDLNSSTGTMYINTDINANLDEDDNKIIMTSSQVKSETDLESFTVNAKAKNGNVEDVKIDNYNDGESDVVVTYKHEGMLLGLFPVTVNSDTVVTTKSDTEPEVKTSLSWWSFLVTKINYNKEELETKLKSNSTIKSNTKINASAMAKAQIAESVIAEVQNNASLNTVVELETKN